MLGPSVSIYTPVHPLLPEARNGTAGSSPPLPPSSFFEITDIHSANCVLWVGWHEQARKPPSPSPSAPTAGSAGPASSSPA